MENHLSFRLFNATIKEDCVEGGWVMNTCWIAGAGEFTSRGFQPEKNDFIIAADGGL